MKEILISHGGRDLQFGYVFNFVELKMFGMLWVMVIMYVFRIGIKEV
jgi:hypothetical protein